MLGDEVAQLLKALANAARGASWHVVHAFGDLRCQPGMLCCEDRRAELSHEGVNNSEHCLILSEDVLHRKIKNVTGISQQRQILLCCN